MGFCESFRFHYDLPILLSEKIIFSNSSMKWNRNFKTAMFNVSIGTLWLKVVRRVANIESSKKQFSIIIRFRSWKHIYTSAILILPSWNELSNLFCFWIVRARIYIHIYFCDSQGNIVFVWSTASPATIFRGFHFPSHVYFILTSGFYFLSACSAILCLYLLLNFFLFVSSFL